MFGSVLVFVYAVLQTLQPCLPPVPLSHEVLASEKYLGKWYFVGVASWHPEDIATFQEIDNSVVELKVAKNNQLIMAGALRENDQCINTAWTYTLEPNLDPVMKEGVDHLGVALDGSWIKCPSCLMFAKVHPNDAIIRIMLFARSESIPDEVVKRFKSKMKCYWIINDFMMAPQKKEFCALE